MPVCTIVAVGLLLVSRGSHAQDMTSEADVMARIGLIQRALDDGQPSVDKWWYGSIIGFTIAGASQGIAAVVAEHEHERQNLAVGAATSFVGVAGQIVFPLEAGRLAARLRAMPEATTEARRLKLAAAEQFLQKAAAQERHGRSWLAHLSSVAVNGAAGLVTTVGFDRPAVDGLRTFAIGQGIAELMMFLQPVKAIGDWDEYRRQKPAGNGAATSWHVQFSSRSVILVRTF